MLASKAGMSVPKSSPAEIKKAKTQKSLYALVDRAAGWYQSQLMSPKNQDIQNYLIDRGITARTAENFRLGYAPSSAAEHKALENMLHQDGFTQAQMIETGILRPSNRGGDPYAFLRDRLVFPVSDRRGRAVAFGGRILPDHLSATAKNDNAGGYKPPKYLNSPETPIFFKGRMLYGESLARQAVGDGAQLTVVEGYMDVIACHQAGFHGAVAPLGTALTPEQIDSLWQMIPHNLRRDHSPIICFDGDNAGIKAADRACERVLPLLRPDRTVRFSFLPKGEDPDSLIKAGGATALQERLKTSLPLIEFLWNRAINGQRFETPESRAGLEKDLNAQISKIEDLSLQHHYRQMIRQKMRDYFRGEKFVATRSWANSRANSQAKPMAASNGQEFGSRQSSVKPLHPISTIDTLRERIILAILINHPDIIEDVEDELEMCALRNPALDRMRQLIIEYHQENVGTDQIGMAGRLKEFLKRADFKKELDLILNENTYIHAGFARPGKDRQNVINGWRDIWSLIYGQRAKDELRLAGQQFAVELADAGQEALKITENETQERFFRMIKQQDQIRSESE